MIKSLTNPEFTRVKYNLGGMNLTEKAIFISKNPPKLKLTAPMHIELLDGTMIIIPSGFVTDGASVPRPLWAIPGFSPFGVLLEGGVPHDFAYQHGFLLAIYNRKHEYPKHSLVYREHYLHLFGDYIPIFIGINQGYFDNLMLEVCSFATNAKVIPKTAYYVLRMSGHFAWNKYRRYGPTAFGGGSLGFPGMSKNGAIF